MTARPGLCPTDDTLAAYGLGKIAGGAADTVVAHLETCPDCRRRVADLSGDSFTDRLRAAAGPKPDGTAEPNKSLSGLSRAVAPAKAPPPELTASGQYADVRELGAGGMGVVYLARNVLMDRDEVLKVVGKGLLARPGAAERFLREIRSAAKLQHPNVVAAYSALQLGDLLVFAMEYAPGDDLSKVVLARGPLPVHVACGYAHHAALGLQHAHERGMVHRDIKPSNLILTKGVGKPAVKVLDFGLAKATSEKDVEGGLTGDGQMMGTPDFMAPEQARDAARADIRADVYALGCTLFYLITGRPPFSGKSLYELLRAHQEAPPERLDAARPGVPAELADAVAKMMAKDPAGRFPTPGEVAKLLVPFTKSGGTAAAPPVVVDGKPVAPFGSGKTVPPGPVPAFTAATPAPPPPPPPPAWRPPTVFRNEAVPQHTRHVNPEDFDPVPKPKPARPKAEGKARPKRKPARKRPAWEWPAVAVGVVLVAVIAAWALGAFKTSVKTRDGILVVESNEPGAEVVIDGEKVTVVWADGGKSAEVTVKPGTHKIEVRKDGFTVAGEELVVSEGGRSVFSARLVRVPAAGPKSADAPKPADPPAEEFVSLFNGKDLTGWKTHPKQPDGWAVENGVLVGKGVATGHLYTEADDYAGVHVRAEVMVNDGGNGGLLARTGFGPAHPAAGPRFPGGYEAEVNATGQVQNKTGGLYAGAAGPVVKATEPAAPAGKWFVLELIANGREVTVRIDGAETARYTDDKARYESGHLALQTAGAGSDVRFRKVEAKRLTTAATPKPADPPAEHFVQLFNGKDLAGWSVDTGDAKQWTVEDGAIVARSDNYRTRNYLLTTAGYSDYVLRFEYLTAAGNVHGGVAVRAVPGETMPRDKDSIRDCPLVKLCAPGHAAKEATGTTHWVRSGGMHVSPVRTPDLPAEVWHAAEVTVRGGTCTVVIDGVTVTDIALDPDPATYRGIVPALKRASGKVGFQINTGTVRYRKVEIKELGRAGAGAKAEGGDAGPKAEALPPPGGPVAFRYRTGATPAELREWAAALPKGHRPVWVSARAGTDARLFDAVAVPDPLAKDWKLAVNESSAEVTADHERTGTRDGYAPVVITPFPGGDVKVWVKGPANVANWFGGGDFIGDKLREVAGGTGWPLSVGVTGRGRGGLHTVSIDHAYGWFGPPKVEFDLDLGPDDLARKVAEYRGRGWRPRHLTAHPGRPDVRYAAVFCENVPPVAWDFSPRLTKAELQAAAAERKAAGFFPQCIASAVEGGEAKLSVVWTADPFQGVKKGTLVPDDEARRLDAATNRHHAREGATYKAEGDELVITGGPNRTGTLLFGDPTWTDYDFTAQVKFAEPVPGASLLVRNDWEYDGRRRPDGLPSAVRVCGVFPFAFSGNTVFAIEGYRDGPGYLRDGLPRDELNPLLKPGVWHTALVKVRGDTVQTYLNGQALREAKPPMPARGGVGLRAIEDTAVRFTNIKVTAPDGKVLFQGLPPLP